MAELKSMSYEESRAEHFKVLMKKMERKIDYWQYRGKYSLKPMGELSRANIECSEAGMQYNFYKDALEALEDNKFRYESGFVAGFAAAQPKWISVEERLPEPERDVLTLHRGKYHCIGYYSEDCELWILNDAPVYDETVTHWMELPQAPKEEAQYGIR